MSFRSIAVFCGANQGRDPRYTQIAESLGRTLASRGLTLVYGGGSVGLMGKIADAALAAGGAVIGVIPQNLVDREVAHGGLTQRHVVSTMHERKALMAQLSDGFIALPGGFGTLDETCEILTWAQLGMHAKPVALLNHQGFYDAFLKFLDHAVAEGFIRAHNRELLLAEPTVEAVLDRLQTYQAPEIPRWIWDRPRA